MLLDELKNLLQAQRMEKKFFQYKYKLRVAIWSGISHCSTCTKYVSQAKSGKANFEKDFLGTHIATTPFQKFLLGIGSGYKSITDPRRGDMVAVMGESTGARAFEYIKSKMLQSQEGRKILEEKPRISSASVDLKKLGRMPEGTLGKTYSNFLDKYKYSPDERLAVRFVDDIELAYVAQRYREAHDLFHTILYMPTNMLGEVTVKWVEALQTGIPMCVTGALFGPLRLAPKFVRTYSTAPVMTLDQEVSLSLKSHLKPRHHPGRIKCTAIALPKDIEDSIISYLVKNEALKLFSEAVESRKSFAHIKIPIEGSRKMKILNRSKVEVLNNLSGRGLDEEKMQQIFEKKMKKLERAITGVGKPMVLDRRSSLIYLMARAPIEYAVVDLVLHEIVKKNPGFKPEGICDFGSGVGTVIWAAKNLWGNTVKEYCGVDISADMSEIASSIIEPEKNNILIKGFIQKRVIPSANTSFDIVVSSFSLCGLGKYNERASILQSLWNITGKYLVVIENGNADGFQIITEARDLILRPSEALSFKTQVLAPCPHEFSCPKATCEAKSNCTFNIKYKDLRIKKDVYGTTNFSYVIFEKRCRNENDKQWPRIVSDVILRKRQAITQLCTSEGKITTVNFTKLKHGPEIFFCAKKSRRGDSLPVSLKYNADDGDDKDCEKVDESDRERPENEKMETEPIR